MTDNKKSDPKKTPKAKVVDPAVLEERDARIEDLTGSLARAQADYQNLVRRTEDERSEISKFARAGLAKDLLPIVDNLERAMGSLPEHFLGDEWIEWVKVIHESFLKVLDVYQIRPFDALGQPVSEEFHEVLSQWPGEEGKVTQVFEKGYRIGDDILRHAKVVVGNGES